MFKTLQPTTGRYFKVLGSLGYKDSEVTWPDWVRNGQNGRLKVFLPPAGPINTDTGPSFITSTEKTLKNSVGTQRNVCNS